MVKFIFRRNDGKVFEMNSIHSDMAEAIWDSIDEYCEIFESETTKIVSVTQREIQA